MREGRGRRARKRGEGEKGERMMMMI